MKTLRKFINTQGPQLVLLLVSLQTYLMSQYYETAIIWMSASMSSLVMCTLMVVLTKQDSSYVDVLLPMIAILTYILILLGLLRLLY